MWLTINILFFSPAHATIFSYPIKKLCYNLCGNDDASAEWQKRVRHALRAYGVKNPNNISIKKISHNAPQWIKQFSSFTLLPGIWINEEAFNHEDEVKKTIVAYHEAAHYALNHPIKMIVYSLFCNSFSYTIYIFNIYHPHIGHFFLIRFFIQFLQILQKPTKNIFKYILC